MKQYQKDIWDTFKGVFGLLFIIVVLISGLISIPAGAHMGAMFVLSLFVPILVASVAVSVIAGIRVNG